MVYKKFQDLELSALGFGTMRLPLAESDRTPLLTKRRQQRWLPARWITELTTLTLPMVIMTGSRRL